MSPDPLKEEIKHLRRRLETMHKERDAALQDRSRWLWVATKREKERASLRTEVAQLRSTLRLLWEQAVDICGPAGATIRRAFTDECREAVVAALGADALKGSDQ